MDNLLSGGGGSGNGNNPKQTAGAVTPSNTTTQNPPSLGTLAGSTQLDENSMDTASLARSAYSTGVTPIGSPLTHCVVQTPRLQQKQRSKVRRSRTIHTISDAIQQQKLRATAAAGEMGGGLGRVRSAASINALGGGAAGGGRGGSKVNKYIEQCCTYIQEGRV